MNVIRLCFLLLSLNSVVYASSNMEGFKIGDSVPIETIRTIDDETLNLIDSENEYILVFYRGSWCPFCMNQLKSIQSDVIPKLKSNQKLVAISVDKVAVAKKMKKKFNFSFYIASEPKAVLLKKFKIANKIDEESVVKYKNSYSIDIEGDSGEKHHIIAHPAVFIIKSGKIVYKDIHVNYKERTKNSEILKNLNN